MDRAEAKQPPAARAVLIVETIFATCAFTIFFASPVLYQSDSLYSMLTAESLLRNRTPDLSGYRIPGYDPSLPFRDVRGGTRPYQLRRINGKLLYWFPHGTSFLSIPLVAILDRFGISAATPDRGFDIVGEVTIQKFIAAALMAAFVVMALRLAMLLLDLSWSAVIAAGSGLGTQVWSTASRGMWSHSWEIVLLLAALYLLLRSAVNGASTRPVILATLLAWAYFVRPTGAVAVFLVGGYMLLYRRDEFAVLAVVGLAWFAVFIAYSKLVFGTLFPVYYAVQEWDLPGLALAVYANLAGPARGLFVYSPICAVIVYLVARNWRTLPFRALALTALLAIAALTLIGSANKIWWGGAAFGPRYLTDAVPWIVLLATLAIAAIPVSRRTIRNPAIAVAAVALVLSVALNAEGAWSSKALAWNYLGPFPGLMLDWSRPQFLAPWMNL